MDINKKTTILFTPEMHRRLTELGARSGRSLGELVREACEIQYGLVGGSDQASAVAELARLELPVDSPEAMKLESVPDPDEVLP